MFKPLEKGGITLFFNTQDSTAKKASSKAQSSYKQLEKMNRLNKKNNRWLNKLGKNMNFNAYTSVVQSVAPGFYNEAEAIRKNLSSTGKELKESAGGIKKLAKDFNANLRESLKTGEFYSQKRADAAMGMDFDEGTDDFNPGGEGSDDFNFGDEDGFDALDDLDMDNLDDDTGGGKRKKKTVNIHKTTKVVSQGGLTPGEVEMIKSTFLQTNGNLINLQSKGYAQTSDAIMSIADVNYKGSQLIMNKLSTFSEHLDNLVQNQAVQTLSGVRKGSSIADLLTGNFSLAAGVKSLTDNVGIATGVMSMASMMLADFAANPMQSVMTGAFKYVFKKMDKKGMADKFNAALGEFPLTIYEKIGRSGDLEKKFLSKLYKTKGIGAYVQDMVESYKDGSTLNEKLQEKFFGKLNLDSYDFRGKLAPSTPVAYDNQTRVSINTVITGYLTRMLHAVSGKVIYHDFQSGEWEDQYIGRARLSRDASAHAMKKNTNLRILLQESLKDNSRMANALEVIVANDIKNTEDLDKLDNDVDEHIVDDIRKTIERDPAQFEKYAILTGLLKENYAKNISKMSASEYNIHKMQLSVKAQQFADKDLVVSEDEALFQMSEDLQSIKTNLDKVHFPERKGPSNPVTAMVEGITNPKGDPQPAAEPTAGPSNFSKIAEKLDTSKLGEKFSQVKEGVSEKANGVLSALGTAKEKLDEVKEKGGKSIIDQGKDFLLEHGDVFLKDGRLGKAAKNIMGKIKANPKVQKALSSKVFKSVTKSVGKFKKWGVKKISKLAGTRLGQKVLSTGIGKKVFGKLLSGGAGKGIASMLGKHAGTLLDAVSGDFLSLGMKGWKWLKGSGLLKNIGSLMSKGAGKLPGFLQGMAKAAPGLFKTAGKFLKGGWSLLKGAGGFVGKIVGGAGKLIKGAGGFISKVAGGAGKVAGKVLNVGKGIIGKIAGSGIGKAVGGVFSKVAGKVASSGLLKIGGSIISKFAGPVGMALTLWQAKDMLLHPIETIKHPIQALKSFFGLGPAPGSPEWNKKNKVKKRQGPTPFEKAQAEIAKNGLIDPTTHRAPDPKDPRAMARAREYTKKINDIKKEKKGESSAVFSMEKLIKGTGTAIGKKLSGLFEGIKSFFGFGKKDDKVFAAEKKKEPTLNGHPISKVQSALLKHSAELGLNKPEEQPKKRSTLAKLGSMVGLNLSADTSTKIAATFKSFAEKLLQVSPFGMFIAMGKKRTNEIMKSEVLDKAVRDPKQMAKELFENTALGSIFALAAPSTNNGGLFSKLFSNLFDAMMGKKPTDKKEAKEAEKPSSLGGGHQVTGIWSSDSKPSNPTGSASSGSSSSSSSSSKPDEKDKDKDKDKDKSSSSSSSTAKTDKGQIKVPADEVLKRLQGRYQALQKNLAPNGLSAPSASTELDPNVGFRSSQRVGPSGASRAPKRQADPATTKRGVINFPRITQADKERNRKKNQEKLASSVRPPSYPIEVPTNIKPGDKRDLTGRGNIIAQSIEQIFKVNRAAAQAKHKHDYDYEQYLILREILRTVEDIETDAMGIDSTMTEFLKVMKEKTMAIEHVKTSHEETTHILTDLVMSR